MNRKIIFFGAGIIIVSIATIFFSLQSEYPKKLNEEDNLDFLEKYYISQSIKNCITHSWLQQPPVYQVNNTHSFLMGPCKYVETELYGGDLQDYEEKINEREQRNLDYKKSIETLSKLPIYEQMMEICNNKKQGEDYEFLEWKEGPHFFNTEHCAMNREGTGITIGRTLYPVPHAFNGIIFENCEQFRNDYDGKLHTIEEKTNRDWIVERLQSCDRDPNFTMHPRTATEDPENIFDRGKGIFMGGVIEWPQEYWEEEFGINFENGFHMPLSCNPDIVEHLVRHSTVFDENTNNIFGMNDIGFRGNFSHAEFDNCRNEIIETRLINSCDDTLHKTTLPNFTIETETHYYDLQYCMWRELYPTLPGSDDYDNGHQYCADLFNVLYKHHTSPYPDCGKQRYNEDGTLRGICEPAEFGWRLLDDKNFNNPECRYNYDEWAYLSDYNVEVFTMHQKLEEQEKRTIDRILDICENYPDKSKTKFYANSTHFIDSKSCEWSSVEEFEKTWGGPGNRHPSFLGYQVPNSCTTDMIKHLMKYSNIFSDTEIYGLNHIGLPDGVSNKQFDICWNDIIQMR